MRKEPDLARVKRIATPRYANRTNPIFAGCPYPCHGFLCWGRDGGYLRTRMERTDGRKNRHRGGDMK